MQTHSILNLTCCICGAKWTKTVPNDGRVLEGAKILQAVCHSCAGGKDHADNIPDMVAVLKDGHAFCCSCGEPNPWETADPEHVAYNYRAKMACKLVDTVCDGCC